MCERVMEVIPFIFEVVFVLDGAIDHYPRAFDNNRKKKINPLTFLWGFHTGLYLQQQEEHMWNEEKLLQSV